MTIEAQALASAILHHANNFEWSLQGMGFIRLHLVGNCRLHVWDKRYRVPGVSMIHDHLQWALNSTVLSGELVNRKYRVIPRYIKVWEGGPEQRGKPFMFATIKPGAGCYFKTEPTEVFLEPEMFPERVATGHFYRQAPDVIHETDAMDGTVTIIRKEPTPDDSARVFWPAGTEWGSAEPRRATPDEVASIVAVALSRWTGA